MNILFLNILSIVRLFILSDRIPFLLLLQNAKYLPNYPSENVGRIYTVKQMDGYWKEIIE